MSKLLGYRLIAGSEAAEARISDKTGDVKSPVRISDKIGTKTGAVKTGPMTMIGDKTGIVKGDKVV